MSRRHKQTETTQDIGDTNDGHLQIVTHSSNRILKAAKSHNAIYDGLMFNPNTAVGLSSDIIHFTDEEEVVYICADFYCVWSESQRKDVVIERNSHHGQLQLIYSIRTNKMNLLASSELVNGCVNRVDIYDRDTKKHNFMNLVSTGRALGMHIINPGQMGIILFDETSINGRSKFSVCLFDVEKDMQCMSQDRWTRALKLIASNFGDFTMILTRENVYELEIDMYNKKMDLSQFDLKRFMETGEECIDACFLKDTIKLVIVTNRMRVFLFDGRLLVSKRELMVPIENIVPFENAEQMEITYNQPFPSGPTGVTFKKLSKPKSIDSSTSEIIVLFEDQSIALFKLDSGKAFNFECNYQLPGEPFKDTQVKSLKLVNGDVMALLSRKTLEAWRMRMSKKSGQENEQLCPKLSAMNYLAQSSLHLWDTCVVVKTLYTIHKDKVFRSWNFEQGLKFSKAMFQTPLSMSVHPLGFQLTISFKQLTRLYIIKPDKLDIIYTLKIRNISSVKYSPNGNRLMILDTPTLHIINPYNYQTLAIFQAALSNVNEMGCYRKRYLFKNESYLWLFDQTGIKLAEKKALLYDMYGESSIAYSDGRKIRLYDPSESDYQDREIQLTHILDEHEKITCIRVVELYGIVLLGTSEGCIVEMLWPIPEQVSYYRYKTSNSSIVNLKVTESYKQLLCVTSTSEIITLDIIQYIDGGQTSGVFVFSNAKINDVYEYEVDEQLCRRSILNREYLFDGYGVTGIRAVEEQVADAEEQSANIALVRGEMEYQKQKNTTQVSAIIDSRKNNYQMKLTTQDSEIKNLQNSHQTRVKQIRQQLKFNLDEYQKKKEMVSDKFDKELLEIIKRSQELSATKLREDERLRNIMIDLRLRNEDIMKGLRHDKSEKFEILMQKYRKLMEAVDEDRRKMASIEFEGDLEQKMFRQRIEEDLNDQLDKATDENEHLTENITKNRKAVANFKKRAKYLENLIDDTEKQIKQLEEDQKQYRHKTAEMVEELKRKELLINQKEELIKRLLVENKHVRGFKDIHEYLMKEYNNETIPNEIKAEQLEDKVKRMNIELLQEIQWRKQAETDLAQASVYMRQLKVEQSSKQKLKHILRTSVNSFAFLLRNMLSSVPPEDWTEALRHIYEMRFTNSNLAEILTRQVVGHDTIQIGEEQIELKKKIEDVMRQKEELSKRQIKEEAISHFQEKYKQELFKKYHGENTELVKEYNLLTKEQKLLKEQLIVLQQSHTYLLNELESENIMIRSLSVSNHKIELKPTPFQRYQQEITTLKKIPSDGKSTGRFSTNRNDNSTVWLKGLIKEVDASKSKLETAEIVRAKVKSFVNPELSKLQTSRIANKMDSPQIPSAVDVFNKLSLENRQVRTKSELIKSVLRRPAESQR